MCLVDYRGFRLIASSILPINHETIIYGSCDAGKNIHAKDSEFNKKMRKISQLLNLKLHKVGNQPLYTPADLEGHKGTDGRYYLVDFSRMFPPEAPVRKIKNSHLFRLLRPELVIQFPTPLCSDS
jgi:hypothetical protein